MSVRAPLLLLLVAGCAPEAAAPSTDGGAAGGFVVSLVPAAPEDGRPAYASVQGKVYDGPVPEAITWTVVEEGGGCRLLTPSVPFCASGCGGSAVCVEGDRCAPQPAPRDLGRVRVTGLGGSAFEMEPIGGNYQPAAGLVLPYPPFAEGDPVRVAAPGGPLGAFAIESRGIAPLVFTDTPAPVAGQPLRLSWTPPGQDLGRIEVKLDVSHHGGARGKIECEVADTGSLELPAAQVTRLLGLGVAGFPTIVLGRVAVGTAMVPGGSISLRVVSAVERPVTIEGLRSCKADNQCPAGKVCRSDLTCQP